MGVNVSTGWRPHESAAVFPQQTASTLRPFCLPKTGPRPPHAPPPLTNTALFLLHTLAGSSLNHSVFLLHTFPEQRPRSEKSSDLRPPLEVLELQELHLCRSHRQDPGRTSVSEDDSGLASVMREGLEPTHWSSGHHGVLPSVALDIQKENVQSRMFTKAQMLPDHLHFLSIFYRLVEQTVS